MFRVGRARSDDREKGQRMTGSRWFCVWIAAVLLLASGCGRRPHRDRGSELRFAAARGDLGQVQMLLARGVPVNAKDSWSGTALHEAAEFGHEEIVQVLVRCGARLDSLDGLGRTPVMAAIEQDRRAIVEYLIREGATTNLRVAAYLADVAMAKSLLEKGVNPAAKDREGWTPLQYAALYGSTEVAKLLVAAVVNRPNDTAEDKARARDCLRGALYQAITNDHEDIAELLIHSAVQMEAFDRRDGAPLCWAARRGSLRLVKLLLAKGANVDASSDQEGTPLRAALAEGHIDIVETLIAAGADVHAKDESGCAAMTVAVTSRCTKAIDDAIREKYGDAGPPGYAEADALVRTVCDSLITRMIDLLVAHGAEVNEKDEVGVTPLHYAAADGLSGAVELLIAKGADVNAKTLQDCWRGSFQMPESVRVGTTALHAAAAEGDVNSVQVLLVHGAQVDARDEAGCTPLHYATRRANARVIELLVAKGADVNAQDREGVAPLSEALRHGYLRAAKVLIAGGAKKVDVKVYPVRTYESDGPIAHLHQALAGRPWAWVWRESRWADAAEPNQEAVRREWIELLLANGADPNERDDRGNTPLHAAILMGSDELAYLFLAHGTPVNAKNRVSTTALHYAAAGGQLGIVARLLAQGADVNVRDNNGNIPLHGAALHAHKDIVEVLLAHGADVGVKNRWGRAPRDEALRRGHKEIVQLLTAQAKETSAGVPDAGTKK
jgi:ankyrin repeat protein